MLVVPLYVDWGCWFSIIIFHTVYSIQDLDESSGNVRENLTQPLDDKSQF